MIWIRVDILIDQVQSDLNQDQVVHNSYSGGICPIKGKDILKTSSSANAPIVL